MVVVLDRQLRAILLDFKVLEELIFEFFKLGHPDFSTNIVRRYCITSPSIVKSAEIET